ncbi:hypothetical protein L3X38_041294 [Prunus dulcis]|uniref:Uncharacterized protein n=1 Tax=Prunus dulcis TaxID=3755 RepID=A0AAD4UUH7_PRUDU|nr:hypothetical protein L3X38_041294 [Prunus dulcis]
MIFPHAPTFPNPNIRQNQRFRSITQLLPHYNEVRREVPYSTLKARCRKRWMLNYAEAPTSGLRRNLALRYAVGRVTETQGVVLGLKSQPLRAQWSFRSGSKVRKHQLSEMNSSMPSSQTQVFWHLIWCFSVEPAVIVLWFIPT